MTTKTKDTMIKFRSTLRGKNSKGGDRIQLYMTQEETQTLVNQLTETLSNERGAKIDMHITRKTAAESGREFDSAFAFVKPTQEGGFGGGVAKKTYVEKGTQTTPTTSLKEKIERAKKEIA